MSTVVNESVRNAVPQEPSGARVDEWGGVVHVACVVRGVSPLLMNSMSHENLLKLWDGPTGKGARTKEKPTPREWAESKAYLRDGLPYAPSRWLMSALIAAGQFVRLDGKRQISTEKKTLLPGLVTLLDNEMPLMAHDGETPARWEVDIQQGRNPNGGEAVCIIRPRFDEWQFSFTLEVDRSQLPLTTARGLVDMACSRCGFGDFRPRCKGTFGRGVVVKWDVMPPPRVEGV